MKFLMLFVSVLFIGSISKASVPDTGLRQVRCYSDWETTLVWEGIYNIVYNEFPKPVIAQKVLGTDQYGRCILAPAAVLPDCLSETMNAYQHGDPCVP